MNMTKTNRTVIIVVAAVTGTALLLAAAWFLLLIGSPNGANGPEPVPLTELEEQWKANTEKRYRCTVDYCGPDMEYRQDSVIYITIAHTNKSPLEALTRDSIERVTDSIASAFLRETDPGRTQSLIYVAYTNEQRPRNTETNIPDERRCYYDIRRKRVIPNTERLLIFRFGYRQPDLRTGNLTLHHLGGYRSKACYFTDLEQDFDLRKVNSDNYKGLDSCRAYSTNKPQKILLNNGYLEVTRDYVFHRDQEISAVITYKCYPENDRFTYAEVVDKLTCKPRTARDRYREEHSVRINRVYLSKKYLDYSTRQYGVIVRATADTSSVPWTIRYETAIDDLYYFKDVDYRYED